jgi:hypothetical protein
MNVLEETTCQADKIQIRLWRTRIRKDETNWLDNIRRWTNKKKNILVKNYEPQFLLSAFKIARLIHGEADPSGRTV